jgi:hypothetical protein
MGCVADLWGSERQDMVRCLFDFRTLVTDRNGCEESEESRKGRGALSYQPS